MALRILVVDDSAVMRSLLIRTIQASGIPVATCWQAGGMAEAMAVLEREEVDVVVVDEVMPGASGRDLVTALRGDADRRHIACVLVGATRTPDDGEGALRGAIPLAKPFTAEQAREAILRALAAARGAVHAP